MEALLILALLACPVGMGLMMWFMGKNMKGEQKLNGESRPRSVTQLRAEESRLAAEIDRLERGNVARDDELAAR